MDADSFWTGVANYNQATWPVQAALIIAGAVLTYLAFTKPGQKVDIWIKIFFAVAFAWNGLVFFLLFVKNPISTYFGSPLFIILAILFVVDIFTKKTQFRLPDPTGRKVLTLFWVLLVVLYPLFGLPLGHTYPEMITPVMPCPLTVLALALVAAAAPRVDKKIYILLLPWALAGLPKCLGALDCYEDCILFGAGVYGLIMLIKDWKGISTLQRAA